METKYCWSFNNDIYYGEFDSEQEAIEDARNSYEAKSSETVYIGTCTPVELFWSTNEDYIIESMYNNLFSEVGDASEYFEVTAEQETELGKRLDNCIRKWIEDMAIEPNCYKVTDGHAVNL